MSMYLKVDILIIIFPLLLSFDSKVHFYTYWPALLPAILLVGALFVVWDAIAARRGDWSFSSKHVMRFRFKGLPLEEILFFFTVPYSCIFIYECLKAYLDPIAVNSHPAIVYAVAGILIPVAGIFRKRYYTVTVAAATAATLAGLQLFFPALLSDGLFWLYLAITYVPFLISNGVLTAIPVVEYSPRAITGLRVYTIPIEDFFYSFTLLSLELMAYEGFKRIML